jgi:hypothetical protein
VWLESADTNMWYRMQALGARMGHADLVVARAYFGGLSTPRPFLDRLAEAPAPRTRPGDLGGPN